MFDWFWRFLYQISKGLYWAIDMVMQCVNKLCGIEPINLGEEKIDFLSYLLTGQNIKFAFASMALLGIVVVVILAVLADCNEWENPYITYHKDDGDAYTY